MVDSAAYMSAVAALVGTFVGGITSIATSLVGMLLYVLSTTHFVVFAEDVLFRGADFSIVWLEILAIAVIGAVYFSFALRRFRSVIFGG